MRVSSRSETPLPDKLAWTIFALGVAALALDPLRLSAAPFWPIVQLATATCLALTLIYGPGLVWFLSRPRAPADLAVAILAGPLTLAGMGLLCWALDGWISPTALARVLVGCLLAVLPFRARRLSLAAASLPRDAAVVIGVGALLVGFAVAKADFSGGPAGELYGGSVSRTLEVGGHSDSRISYHVVQVVAHHLAPFSPQAYSYFAPYSFVSRGPLAGLLAVPLVLATGAEVPNEMPDQPWQPFDPQGFAVYRIALIVVASLAAWAVFGIAASVLDSAWALLACATLFLAPFFAHELYFTWPKFMAAACALLSFQFVRDRKSLAAGLTLGAGYLFHPLAVFSAPFLALWLLADGRSGGWVGRGRQLACFCGGILLPVLCWQALALFDPEKFGRQSGFLHYFLMADGGGANWAIWWRSRVQSLANTFVPFHMLWVDPAHREINAYHGQSDGWVHFGFLYWNTFPFALGLPAFVLTAPAVIAMLWHKPAATFAILVGPACLLIAYMGAADTGLMRYCGQVLFLSSVPFAIWALAQPGGRWRQRVAQALAHPLFLTLCGLDVAWMAFAPTLHNHVPDLADKFGPNDLIALAAAAACLTAAVIVLGRALKDFKGESPILHRGGAENTEK